jgi:dTMP kinase
MTRKGLFLVFEGGEGSGKTTQAKLLAEALGKEGKQVVLTKEPGGDEGVCRDIRTLLLNPKYKGQMSDRAELFLFESDRAQHVDKVIRPALDGGNIVVSDRYEAATYAYQCAARGVCHPSRYEELNSMATGGLRPNFAFLIDIDPREGLKRNINAQKRDRFEMEDVSFHDKVRAGYKDYFEKRCLRGEWKMFDGCESIEELHRQILETLKNSGLLQ